VLRPGGSQNKYKYKIANNSKFRELKRLIKVQEAFAFVHRLAMDHHHNQNASGSAEKKVKIDKFLFHTIFLPFSSSHLLFFTIPL
jgi:predicted HAD superfamily hydrolase